MSRHRARQVLREIARRDLGGEGKFADRTRVDALGDELGPAIANGQLHLVYQPIVDLRTGSCERVEALVRWRHPILGVVDPRDLVRLARARGLLAALITWAVRAAARQHERWAREGASLALSLKLAGDELTGGGPNVIRAAIDETGLDPRSLTFEIPAERVTLHGLWDGARSLASDGARIAIDDLSSADAVSRAVAVDVDELKISRAVIRRVVADRSAATAARALIEAARDLGLRSVAVGIEDRITSEWLTRAGCSFGQGYAVSEPLAATDVATWRRWAARLTFGSTALVAVSAVPAAVFAPHHSVTAPITGQNGGTTCCSLQTSAGAHDTGLAMKTVAVGGVHVHVEASAGDDVVARISAAVARDVPAAQTDLGASFAHSPDVYVLTSRASFALALQNGFGQRASDAAALSVANGGVAFPAESAIVINWAGVSSDHDLAVVRHELTHLLVHQIAGVDTQIPAWLDEGLAMRAEHMVSPDAARDARDASATLSLARSGAVSLSDLSSAGDWTVANAHLDGRGYAVATEAVNVLEHSLGHDGITGLLKRAHQVGFAQAFGEATGGSAADFANAFPAQSAALHGGAWISQQDDAGGVHWSAAGFTAGAKLHVVIDGGSYHVEYDAVADHDGVYSALFGGTAPSGDYNVSVASAGMSATSKLAI